MGKQPAKRPRGRPPKPDKLTDTQRHERYMERLRAGTVKTKAGYWKLPPGIAADEFETWLESKGYRAWLRRRGIGE